MWNFGGVSRKRTTKHSWKFLDGPPNFEDSRLEKWCQKENCCTKGDGILPSCIRDYHKPLKGSVFNKQDSIKLGHSCQISSNILKKRSGVNCLGLHSKGDRKLWNYLKTPLFVLFFRSGQDPRNDPKMGNESSENIIKFDKKSREGPFGFWQTPMRRRRHQKACGFLFWEPSVKGQSASHKL